MGEIELDISSARLLASMSFVKDEVVSTKISSEKNRNEISEVCPGSLGN